MSDETLPPIPEIPEGRWIGITPNINEIPLNRILMTWNGISLSAPQVFRYRHMADDYQREHNVKQWMIIPNPQL